jgi:hypothetical protein
VGRVQKFTADGKFLLAWGDNEDKPGSFGGVFSGQKGRIEKGPVGLCVDAYPNLHCNVSGGLGDHAGKMTAERDDGNLSVRFFGGAPLYW